MSPEQADEASENRQETLLQWDNPDWARAIESDAILAIDRFGSEDRIVHPRRGEVVALTLTNLKTATLCYDRVWAPTKDYVPDAFRCFGDTDIEVAFLNLIQFVQNHGRMLREWKPGGDKALFAQAKARYEAICGEVEHNFYPNLRRLAATLSNKYGASTIPILHTTRDRDLLFRERDYSVIYATVENLNIVDEKSLQWEQVREFRADVNTQRKYRHFLHWLDKEMIGKSFSFIQDEICCRLEDYEKALQKHEIRTLVGTISEAIDGKYVLGGTAVGALANHPVLGVLAGAAVEIGKIGVKVAQVWLDRDDIRCGTNSEISWVYEVKAHLAGAQTSGNSK